MGRFGAYEDYATTGRSLTGLGITWQPEPVYASWGEGRVLLYMADSTLYLWVDIYTIDMRRVIRKKEEGDMIWTQQF
jgi:hypothetical protein